MTRRNHRRADWRPLLLGTLVIGFVTPLPGSANAVEAGCNPAQLQFGGLPHGALLTDQLSALGVHASAVANEGRPNQLVIFDSNLTTTPDPDLQAGIGNLAIIPENVVDANGDGLVDQPSDSIRGGTQVYRFDHLRRVTSFQIVDIDHGLAASHFATAYDDAGRSPPKPSATDA